MGRTLLACLFLVFCCSASFAADKTFGDVTAIIVDNYDGDTLTVNIPEYPPVIGELMKVRVRHVDTPEIKSRDPRAVQAKELVASICPAGTMAILRNVGRDMYFRLDADVLCAGKDVGAELLAAGLAHGNYEGGTKAAW